MAMTLREARKHRGWTQEQLEDASGVKQTIISRLERGAIANPGISTVRKLEAALKIKPLLFGDASFQEQAS